MAENNYFYRLYSIPTVGKTDKKKNLDYLPWATAWSMIKSEFPDASYEIVKFDCIQKKTITKKINENTTETIETETKTKIPYVVTGEGIVVFTNVTVNGITHEMHLTVMDGANKAMKDIPYEYSTKDGVKKVIAATMFDISKTIMRCLVKNIAMHGIGINIYEGDEISAPISDMAKIKAEITEIVKKKTALSEFANDKVMEILDSLGEDINKNYNLVDDIDVLKDLKKRLQAVRKW